MGFKDFLIGENISPICACNTCEHIYDIFKKFIYINADVSGTEIETLKISVGFYKKEIEKLKQQIENMKNCSNCYIGETCSVDDEPCKTCHLSAGLPSWRIEEPEEE